MPKKTESEDPLEFFNIHSVAKVQKIEGGTLSWGKNFFEKKSHSAEKNLKGDLLVSSGIVCYVETFLVQFLGPTGTFWDLLNFVELLVELFWSVQVVLKNTDEKP